MPSRDQKSRVDHAEEFVKDVMMGGGDREEILSKACWLYHLNGNEMAELRRRFPTATRVNRVELAVKMVSLLLMSSERYEEALNKAIWTYRLENDAEAIVSVKAQTMPGYKKL